MTQAFDHHNIDRRATPRRTPSMPESAREPVALSQAFDDAVHSQTAVERARAFADLADERHRAGISLGPLDGRIVSVDSALSVPDQSAASDWVAGNESHALIAARLLAAGAVVVGRTSIDVTSPSLAAEDGAGSTSPESPHAGIALSVAAGTSDLGVSFDPDGSVRAHAGLKRLVSFHPSEGEMARPNDCGLAFGTDAAVLLGRSVQDLGELSATLSGGTSPLIVPFPWPRLRIGVLAGRIRDAGDCAINAAVERYLECARFERALLYEIDFDPIHTRLEQIEKIGSFLDIETAFSRRLLLADAGFDADRPVRVASGDGAEVTAVDFLLMLHIRNNARSLANALFRGVDVLALPTGAASVNPDHLPDNARYIGMLNLPFVTLSVPKDFGSSGALTLVGRRGGDQELLEIALAFEGL